MLWQLPKIGQLFRRRTRQPGGWFRPQVEMLEDRFLPSTFTVTDTSDDPNDVHSLRHALANLSPGGNTVNFAIGTPGPGSVQIINVGSISGTPLPAITQPVDMEGFTQGGAGYNGPPLIVLNGAGAGSGADGLELDAGSDGSTVRGLVIQQFSSNGIEVKGASGILITGNYLGTNAAGTSGQGNANDGILLDSGAKRNTIGGTTPTAGNVISGNGSSNPATGVGVELSGSGTSDNVVQGNLIGTDSSDTVALGNVNGGLLMDQGASANTVGGTTPGAANVICNNLNGVPGPSGNPTQAAVLALQGGTISGNIARFDIEINYVDTPPDEMVYLGLDVRGSSSSLAPINPSTNQPDFSAFNFVPSGTLGPNWAPVGNAFPGEFLFQTPPPPGTQLPSGLQPNSTYLVGTLTYDLSRFSISPTAALSISIAGTDTIIGAEQPGNPSTFHFIKPTFATPPQPLMNGPTTSGVEIRDPGTDNNLVQGNRIGTDRSGTTPLGHLTDGLRIDGGASGNLVGGTTPGSGNVVANNNEGVVVGSSSSDTSTVHNSILGNTIFGNTGLGIDLGSLGTTVAEGANPRAFPNNGQNAPVITALTLNTISGTLTSVPRTSFRIELYTTPVGGAASQGQTFLGFLNVTTNSSGHASFTFPVKTSLLGQVVTATATNRTTGDTSDFSPAGTQMLVITNPTTGPSTASQTVSLTVQVLSGSLPATSAQVTITIPGLPGQVTVTPNAGGLATATFQVPAGSPPGKYTIIATLPAQDEMNGGRATGVLIIPRGKVGRRWSR